MKPSEQGTDPQKTAKEKQDQAEKESHNRQSFQKKNR